MIFLSDIIKCFRNESLLVPENFLSCPIALPIYYVTGSWLSVLIVQPCDPEPEVQAQEASRIRIWSISAHSAESTQWQHFMTFGFSPVSYEVLQGCIDSTKEECAAIWQSHRETR